MAVQLVATGMGVQVLVVVLSWCAEMLTIQGSKERFRT